MSQQNSAFRDRLEKEVGSLKNKVVNSRDYVEKSDEATLGLIRGLLSVINDMCNAAYTHEKEIAERRNEVTQLFAEYERATKSYLRLSVDGNGESNRLLSKMAQHVLLLKQQPSTANTNQAPGMTTKPSTTTRTKGDGLLDDLLGEDMVLSPEDEARRNSFFKSQYFQKFGQNGYNSKPIGSPTSRRIHNNFVQSSIEGGLKPAISIGNGLGDMSFDNELRCNKKVSVEVQTEWRMATLGSPNHTASNKKNIVPSSKPSTSKKIQLIKSFCDAKPTISIQYEATPKKAPQAVVASSPRLQNFYLNHKRHFLRPLDQLIFTPGSGKQLGSTSSRKQKQQSTTQIKPSWVANTKILRMSSLDDRKRAPSPKESLLNISKTESTNIAAPRSERGSFLKTFTRSEFTGNASVRDSGKASSRDRKNTLYHPATKSARGSVEDLLDSQFDPDSVHNPRLIANLYSGLAG